MCIVAIDSGITPWELLGVERSEFLFETLLAVHAELAFRRSGGDPNTRRVETV